MSKGINVKYGTLVVRQSCESDFESRKSHECFWLPCVCRLDNKSLKAVGMNGETPPIGVIDTGVFS